MMSILLFSLDKKAQIEEVETLIYKKNDSTNNVDIDIAISRTPRELAIGLMGVKKLPPASGMLFIFESERKVDEGFWMYQTLIPLDIAFLNKNGEILSIHQMEPCKAKEFQDCPKTYSHYPYYYALEMNKGFFNKYGYTEGDYVDLGFLETKS
jgi:hypothetical protein